MLLAACGSSKSSSGTSGAAAGAAPIATTSPAVAAARVRAASCMRSQGIDIPSVTGGQGQLTSVLRKLGSYPAAKVRTALRACAADVRAAFPGALNFTPAQRAQRLRSGGSFASCMRTRGIAFPTPATAAGNPSAYFRALGSLRVNSPAYRAAASACRARLSGG
jgi:hypothetical protein